MTENYQYADVPPEGFKLLTMRDKARLGDMVYVEKECAWEPVRQGQNRDGATLHELWSTGVLGLARRMKANGGVFP